MVYRLSTYLTTAIQLEMFIFFFRGVCQQQLLNHSSKHVRFNLPNSYKGSTTIILEIFAVVNNSQLKETPTIKNSKI